MVTAQAYCTVSHQSNGELIDDTAGIGATVDVIAKINFGRMTDRPALQVVIDAGDYLREKIRATVNIADSVDACFRRKRGARGRMVGSC